jgi:ATP-binding cassette subfamily B protein
MLFSGSIEKNILWGNEDAGHDAVVNAAEIAQAAPFVDARADGYETVISQGGVNVSGGQKQRLSIARALIKDPAILIFDDSFSALDMKTDAELRKALAEKTGHTTRIIVAQRVGTIMNAEQIIVLDEGRIAGKGTHSELMQKCKVYREIALSQLSEMEALG